jgi:hypothetical protein
MLVTAITGIYCDDTKHIGVIIESNYREFNMTQKMSTAAITSRFLSPQHEAS